MICVIVATYRRLRELRRLLERLREQSLPVGKLVIADNAADPAVEALVNELWPGGVYLALPENRGCGAGLRAAEEYALKEWGETLSFFWVLDDDAVPPNDCLKKLVEALDKTGAGMAVPLCRSEDGSVWAFPEPLDRRLQQEFRRWTTPESIQQGVGSQKIHPLAWSCGVCQLIRRAPLMDVGLHRPDYWMLGEDLELSMRISRKYGAVFRTDVVVDHLPFPTQSSGDAELANKRKFLALLQNLTYMVFYVPGSRHMWRYLPGNFRRFFRSFGLNSRTLSIAITVFVNGALRAEPAGGPYGNHLRAKLDQGLLRF